MEWLNYHHLLYFWMAARTGSVTRASEELRLAPPTVSAQIHRLEEVLGEKLFARSGRRLILTEEGKTVFRYADEIFSLGRELTDTLKGRPTGRPLRVVIGLADVVPKSIAFRLIEPAFHLASPVRVICREDPPDRLLGLLAVHQLDLILSDAPLAPGIKVRAFSHPLGECGVGFYGKPKLAAKIRRNFPRALDGAPFLLPTEGASLRAGLDHWFDSQGVRPIVVGEFDDFTLARTFAEGGLGLFAAPSVLDSEMRHHHGFERVGRTEEVCSHFFAISVERKVKNPAVAAICEAARARLFSVHHHHAGPNLVSPARA